VTGPASLGRVPRTTGDGLRGREDRGR